MAKGSAVTWRGVAAAVLLGIAALGIMHVEAPNLQPLAPMGYRPFIPV